MLEGLAWLCRVLVWVSGPVSLVGVSLGSHWSTNTAAGTTADGCTHTHTHIQIITVHY